MPKLSVLLLGVSLLLSALGGWADLTGVRIFGLSREHYWRDATYLAVLAIAVHMIWKA